MPRYERLRDRVITSEGDVIDDAATVVDDTIARNINKITARIDQVNGGHKKGVCLCSTCLSDLSDEANQWTNMKHGGNQANEFVRNGKKIGWRKK